MTNEGHRRIGTLALFAATVLVVLGSVVACATTEQGEQGETGPEAGQAPAADATPEAAGATGTAEAPAATPASPQVVVTPVAQGPAEAPTTAAAAPQGSWNDQTFLPYYHPEAPSYLQAMEASLKPLVSIPAQD